MADKWRGVSTGLRIGRLLFGLKQNIPDCTLLLSASTFVVNPQQHQFTLGKSGDSTSGSRFIGFGLFPHLVWDVKSRRPLARREK